MKEFIVGLFKSELELIDETSVDAYNEEEALKVAADLFSEFHLDLDMEFIKNNIRIVEAREIPEEDVKSME